jgi:Tfp pilus assembly protein PilF
LKPNAQEKIGMAEKTRKQMLEEMLDDEQNDPELRYMLAMEHAGEGDDEGAVRRFEEIFLVAPDYAPAYHMAARALVRLGKIDEARATLQRGIPAAQQQGNVHAAGEMTELLESLEVG